MINDKIKDFNEEAFYKGEATIQIFNENGEKIEEVVQKNAVNGKVAKYFYEMFAEACPTTYLNSNSYGSFSMNPWQTLRLSHSRWIDTYVPHECDSYYTLASSSLYNPHSSASTVLGTINRKETTCTQAYGAIGRKTYVPYTNYVVDFPTHVANTTFDSLLITGSIPTGWHNSDYNYFHYFRSSVSKTPIIHNDRTYALSGNYLISMSSRWDKYANSGEYRSVELHGSDANLNNSSAFAFYNNRLYVFTYNKATGQSDVLEVLGYAGATASVVTVKSNLYTDMGYFIVDVAIRNGKIIMLKGKTGTRNLKVDIYELSNFSRVHTHEFEYSGTANLTHGEGYALYGVAINHRNRVAFYFHRSDSNTDNLGRVDIILSDYSHVDWGTKFTERSYPTWNNSGSSSYCPARFSNLYGFFKNSSSISGTIAGAGNRYVGRAVPRFTNGVTHMIKLDKPITKTETNTMKIQYRVEFENPMETFIPYADEFGNAWS